MAHVEDVYHSIGCDAEGYITRVTIHPKSAWSWALCYIVAGQGTGLKDLLKSSCHSRRSQLFVSSPWRNSSGALYYVILRAYQSSSCPGLSWQHIHPAECESNVDKIWWLLHARRLGYSRVSCAVKPWQRYSTNVLLEVILYFSSHWYSKGGIDSLTRVLRHF